MLRTSARAAVALFMVFGLAQSATGFTGHVVDDATGQPLEGVWVLGNWTAGGGLFAHGSGGCLLAVTRTNPRGEFKLEAASPFWGRLFPRTSRERVYFYKAAYGNSIKPDPDSEDRKPFRMERDASTGRSRVELLSSILDRADCGTHYNVEHRDSLLPFFCALYSEAIVHAQSEETTELAQTISARMHMLYPPKGKSELNLLDAFRVAAAGPPSQCSVVPRSAVSIQSGAK